jgi:mono/diheme cytochrome c family protein
MIRHARCVREWSWLFVVLLLLAGWQASCLRSRAEQRGKQLFELHCAACHEASNPDLKKQPSKLEGLFQSKRLPSGAPAADEQVRKTIIQAIATMLAFHQRLSDEGVNDLVKYLHQLK